MALTIFESRKNGRTQRVEKATERTVQIIAGLTQPNMFSILYSTLSLKKNTTMLAKYFSFPG
jgi:hypothetical protein